jgi:hypothetical protein
LLELQRDNFTIAGVTAQHPDDAPPLVPGAHREILVDLSLPFQP